jgi:hypothetical protein
MMKLHAGMIEGPESWTRFTAGMQKILSVSKDELNRREAAYKAQSNLNPRKRGPKPKVAHGADAQSHA